jgi:hypothetical protein
VDVDSHSHTWGTRCSVHRLELRTCRLLAHYAWSHVDLLDACERRETVSRPEYNRMARANRVYTACAFVPSPSSWHIRAQ